MAEALKIEMFQETAQDRQHHGSGRGRRPHWVSGDGIVAVGPIDKLFLIHTKAEAAAEEFWLTLREESSA